MAEILTFKVTEECDGMKAQYFLKDICKLSSRMITRLKREKDGILMDGKLLRTVDTVEKGKIVEIRLPEEESAIVPIKGDPDIAYEDQYLLIVNKPPLMPVHPVKQHQEDTLANIVSYYNIGKGESYIFRALNRLDRDTSGLVLIAKDRYCANKLKFSVDKTYFALCHGEIKNKGTLRAPIGLKADSKMVRYVLDEGSDAITHYEPIFFSKEYSFLKLKLETGKTHQIRCHMAYLGHPLLGDDLYGGSRDMIGRQALHCGEMSFKHPITDEDIFVSCNIPEDMNSIISKRED